MNERRWNRRFNFIGENSKGSLTEGSVIKGFLLFALPLFLGSLFQQLYGTTDLIFVGNFMGKTEAAAVGASSILITCLIGLFTGISVGAGVITGNFQGAGEKERVRNSIENALALAFFGGLFLMMLGQVLAEQALIWLNTPENIMKEALTYVRIYLMAVLSMIKCRNGCLDYCQPSSGSSRSGSGHADFSDIYNCCSAVSAFSQRKIMERKVECDT